jgi:hypothetical protein
MRYCWLAWWQARRYWLLASMTCRRYSSAGISNGTPRTRLGGPGMWAGHPRGQLHRSQHGYLPKSTYFNTFRRQSGRHSTSLAWLPQFVSIFGRTRQRLCW